MCLRRVVITGMGVVSPFGRGVPALMDALLAGRSGVTTVPELGAVGGLRSQVAGLVPEVDAKEIPRKHRRSMSPMSVYATLASRDALAAAGLGGAPGASDGRLGISIGSTIGSPHTLQDFFEDYLTDHSLERIKSTLFFRMMNHSCAANVAQALEISGRLNAPASACSTGCQAVGYGFEMIAMGKQDRMLCGGADEFHPLTTATFDVMNAASCRYNAEPTRTPRPFDRDRDGVVCSEGAGVLLLEALEAAVERGAPILAEVVGFGTVTDPSNIASPSAASVERCVREALADAGVDGAQIDYVNAHATATEQGDAAESEAIRRVFGDRVPVSSLKGHLGHTMAASGAIELAATVEMMSRDVLVPTLNLAAVDPACAGIRHVTEVEAAHPAWVIKNNFAMGGVNSALVLRRYER